MPTGEYIRTASHKRKISESLKGRVPWIKGLHHSEETKKKISVSVSKALIGHVVTEETKNKLRIIKSTFRHTKETKEKMSESRKGIKNSFYGKTHTQAVRQKLRELKLGKTYEEIYGKEKANAKKLKMKNSMISGIKYGKIKINNPSKSCVEFLNKLENMFDVKIEREIQLSGKFYDGKFNNILIEVDSDYWHNINKTDDIKNEIAKNNNFILYRFKVNGIKEVDAVINKNLDALKNILENKNE